MLSLLQKQRAKYQPSLPKILEELNYVIPKKVTLESDKKLKTLFPHTSEQPLITFEKGTQQTHHPLKVGVVLSGGQAPGGHNVISGLYDALKKLNAESILIGFLDGPSGLIKNKTKKIDEALLKDYRNQGGFDIIGSGRTKVETPEQFAQSLETVKLWDLDGLVIIGGDDSNTNAAFLAEYFLKHEVKTKVIGVPKTIDGDLKNDYVEISFGFDTATKIYSEIIGNILKDMISAKKYYYFIKLMGRSASHVTLECELATHANMALIGEEIANKKLSLQEVVNNITDMICKRAEEGKNYGAILISEGVIEFIHDFQEIKNLPEEIQKQLLLEKDPHGNIQISRIESERLFISLVEAELKKRKDYKGKFSPIPLFCGYEGRSGLPSNFDCQYCYSLGYVAALLISFGLTGYMAYVQNLIHPINEWKVGGVPIYNLLHEEPRGIVIKKTLVDLNGKPFQHYLKHREEWAMKDDFCCPGPIQFEGAKEITDAVPNVLIFTTESTENTERK